MQVAEINPKNSDALGEGAGTDPGSPQQKYGDPEPTAGALLELEEPKAAALAAKLWEALNTHFLPLTAQWDVNEARRRGIANVMVMRDQDKGWKAHIPLSATADRIPAFNKAAWLCRRFCAVLLADPPAPELIPSSNDDDDVESAELEQRILDDLTGPSKLNDAKKYRRALSLSCNTGRAYVYWRVDPKRGGRKPIEVEASPQATSYEDAIDRPVMQPVMAPVMVPHPEDPTQMIHTGEMMDTGQQQPVMDETGEPMREPWPGEYITRYLRPDGTLTDEPGEAALQWTPDEESEAVSGRNVRLLPHTALSIDEADGLIMATLETWGELKSIWPDLAELEQTEEGKAKLKELMGYKMKRQEDLLPLPERRNLDGDDDDKVRDNRRVPVYTIYYRAGQKYADGCYVVALGDSIIACRQPWVHMHDDGCREELLIPFTEVQQFDEGRGHPVALMEQIGPGNEIRQAVIGTMLDHLERFGNRLKFLPMNSNLQPHQLERPAGSVLRILPGSQPFYEELPTFPTDAMTIKRETDDEMNSASGLEQAAQGLEDPSVTSGKQTQLIVAQVHAGLSDIQQNMIDAATRGYRIALQLARCFLDKPRQLGWSGDDGEYRQRAWMASDLSSSRDVRTSASSMTMMSKQAKAELASSLAQQGLIDPDRYRDIVMKNIGGLIGLQDDKHRMRIRRQVSLWLEGPPDGWQPNAPQTQTNPIGQAVVVPAQPTDAETTIWQPVPADLMPAVAQVRIFELAQTMATKKYLLQPAPWRAAYEAEFQRMATALQPPPPVAPAPAQQPQAQVA